MADEEDGGEKPFEATPRKLQEARRRGDFPVSQDLVTVSVFVSILLTAAIFGEWSTAKLGAGLMPFLQSPDLISDVVFQDGGSKVMFGYALVSLTGASLWLLLPFVFALLCAGAQGALVFAPEKLKPKLNRISPISNAKQKFGRDGLFNFLKSFLKLSVYSLVLFLVCRANFNEIVSLPNQPLLSGMAVIASLCFRFLLVAAIVMGVIAALDFFWQRAEFLRKQRMSLKELRDEAKDTDGDPHTKQARRQKAYDIATNQMIADVPAADVVIVNPTHFAVALKWERQAGTAPHCVAKGVDEVAARIRSVAMEHGVPIYRDPPTARNVYDLVEIGQEIRLEHYRAIAAAIRFADKIKKRAKLT